jgi:tripartite-type tricarboxylate transporter receptor subunit TctC
MIKNSHLLKKAVLTVVAGALMATAAAGTALAQAWPARQITMVVPFPAGGPADVVARMVGAEITRVTSQPVVIENRAGAGGNIGANSVAKAAPDGYTLLFVTPGPAANNKLMYKSMPYDPETDLAPVAYVANSPLIIVGNPKVPAKTMKELVAYAKANPGKVTAGHPGNGTLGHIASALFAKQAGISLTLVPYKGTAPLTTDVLGGQVDLAVDFMPTYIPLVKDGKLTGFAVTTEKRVSLTPDIGTVMESGVANFESVAWYALMGPKGLPADIVQKLNKIVNDYIQTPEAKDKMAGLGVVPAGGSPEVLGALVKSELTKWAPIIKENNISFE